MWKNNDCPCTRDCPDRWVSVDGLKPLTCHCTCPKYKEWVAKRDAEKKSQLVASERDALTESHRKKIWKSYRRDYSGVHKKVSA